MNFVGKVGSCTCDIEDNACVVVGGLGNKKSREMEKDEGKEEKGI